MCITAEKEYKLCGQAYLPPFNWDKTERESVTENLQFFA